MPNSWWSHYLNEEHYWRRKIKAKSKKNREKKNLTIFGCDIPCFAVTVEVLLCLVMVELILFNKFIGLAEKMYLFIIFDNSHQLQYRGKLTFNKQASI